MLSPAFVCARCVLCGADVCCLEILYLIDLREKKIKYNILYFDHLMRKCRFVFSPHTLKEEF